MSPLEKAAMEAYRAYDSSRQAEWGGLGPTNQRRYKDIARAVLLAVRDEPPGWLSTNHTSRAYEFRAVIDAILEGE